MWLEYLVDWSLIERAESEIAELLHLSGIEPSTARITREETGLTVLVEVQRYSTTH